MAPRVELVLAEAAAHQWPALVASLWPRPPERPTCLFATLSGEAQLVGRFGLFDPSSPSSTQAVRRATGGRTLRAGDGCLAIAIAVQHTGALLADGGDIPPRKIVNRFVRPVLGLLNRAGVGAAYFGRDFISASSRAVASVGWDSRADGGALFECVVGMSRSLADDEPWSAATTAEHALRHPGPELAKVLEQAFLERLGVEVVPGPPAPQLQAPSWPPAFETLPRARASRDIPIGQLHAFVDALGTEGGTPRIARAALRGDFQADAESVLRLEHLLAGCPAVFEEVGKRVDAVFGPRGLGTIVGLKSLAPIAEAFVEAARETS